ncbi:glycosyltransferase [Methylobacillus gramineus]|uniref:glycosyltransferase n=1 Tax=Methylobacillus gramineus TaxID=755169 RepID=UPI001CFF8D4E|nr:glycosyltransferase [Methylobacillus gramineus]MCB5184897.1 glycosyltransferase [Methylobacillus gramineus]
MEVLHICHSYYPPFLDCARQYAALFAGTAYRVVTVYLTGKPDLEVERQSGSDEVIFLGYTSKQVRGLKLRAIADIRKLVAKHDFKFCIAHRAKPTYVALLATSLPVISVHHNYGDFGRVSRRLMVNLFRSRLFMLAVSNSVRDEIRCDLASWPHERIQTLYNRIDVEAVKGTLLTREDARQVLDISLNSFVIANVGRLHYDKDQATLIRGFASALPALPTDSLLLIVGKGPLEHVLKQLVRELGITQHVRFTGQIADARRYFRAFDIFALTSDHEPFGMVLLEAMAASVSIICSESGGGAEVVQDVGVTFPLGNAPELAKVIVKASQEHSLIDRSVAQTMLHEKFSDEAARAAFWRIGFVNSLSQ